MFKSRSSQFVFVHPNLSKICTQSVSLVVYYVMCISVRFGFGYTGEHQNGLSKVCQKSASLNVHIIVKLSIYTGQSVSIVNLLKPTKIAIKVML